MSFFATDDTPTRLSSQLHTYLPLLFISGVTSIYSQVHNLYHISESSQTLKASNMNVPKFNEREKVLEDEYIRRKE